MAASKHVSDEAREADYGQDQQLWQDLQGVEELVPEGERWVGVDGNDLQKRSPFAGHQLGCHPRDMAWGP